MQLTDLIGVLDEVELVGAAGAGVDVTRVDYDSRQVEPGALFSALPGAAADGRDFVPEAVSRGAVAVLCESPVETTVPQLVVPDARRAMGVVAGELAGHPSRSLRVVGVTGTNGKTTVTHLVAHLVAHAGLSSRVIGTLTGQRTTPESPDLQNLLRSFVDDGVDVVAMEVSSHALSLRRVVGTRFEVAVFTNLSRDHLDFHASMEDYFNAKAELFTPELAERALVDVDDPRGRLLLEAALVPTRGYGFADVDHLHLGLDGSRFRWRGIDVHLPLGGTFNVANAIAALEVGVELGLDPAVLGEGLASVPTVPGRFELVDRGQPFTAVVDYAHTPDGLEQVLTSARSAAGGGRVLVVFGCGGDRDVTKRPAMGEVASRLADQVFLTSDNPRGEDPQEIIDDVKTGIASPDDLVVDPDRRSAIGAAIDAARPGDVVVVAGKGHETTQTIGEQVLPFDDRAVVAELLDQGRAAR